MHTHPRITRHDSWTTCMTAQQLAHARQPWPLTCRDVPSTAASATFFARSLAFPWLPASAVFCPNPLAVAARQPSSGAASRGPLLHLEMPISDMLLASVIGTGKAKPVI